MPKFLSDLVLGDNASSGINLSLGTTTGTKFGTSTTQKLSFYGVTPVVQQGATTDLKDALTSYGLITGTSATPLNLDGGAMTCGLLTASVSGTGSTYQADYFNPSAGSGNTAGFALRTQSGWHIKFRTNQDRGWFEIADGTNLIQHRWMAKDYMIASGGKLLFSSETDYSTAGVSTGDTNLYRSAADTLKTDDNFIVGGNLTVTGSTTLTNTTFNGFRSIYETRTLPVSTGTNNSVAIGSFALTNGAGYIELDAVVADTGFSIAKRYVVPVGYNATGTTWYTLLPLSSTGVYSGQDFDLDIQVNAGTCTLRARRKVGTTAGTLRLTITHYGVITDTYTSSSTVSTVTAPDDRYVGTPITTSQGGVTINGSGPSDALTINALYPYNALTVISGANATVVDGDAGLITNAGLFLGYGAYNTTTKVFANSPGYITAASANDITIFANSYVRVDGILSDSSGTGAVSVQGFYSSGTSDMGGYDLNGCGTIGFSGWGGIIGENGGDITIGAYAGVDFRGSAGAIKFNGATPIQMNGGSISMNAGGGTGGGNLVMDNGSITTAASLTLTTGTTSTNAVNFGSDVNLYRSAANVLKTDDSLFVAANLGVGASPSYKLDVQNSGVAVQAAFGDTKPFYLIANEPNLGFNAYYNAGWKFGRGSTAHYGASWGFDTSVGSLAYSVSSANGTADAAMTLNTVFSITQAGKVGIGQTTPTAFLHLKAGTATANTAPLKLTSGTNLTTPEAGAFEFNGTHLYFTIGSTRYQLDQQSTGSGTPGGSDTQVQFNDAGAFGGNSGLTYNKTTNALTVGGVLTGASLTLTSLGSISYASGSIMEVIGNNGVTVTGTGGGVLIRSTNTGSGGSDVQLLSSSTGYVMLNAGSTRSVLVGASTATTSGAMLQTLGSGEFYTTSAIGTTSTDGLILANNNAATSGVTVQMSPRLLLTGYAWKSNATAVSQRSDWIIENLPATGATTITSTLKFGHMIASTGRVDPMTLSNASAITLSGTSAGVYTPDTVSTGSAALIFRTGAISGSGLISSGAVTLSSGACTTSSGTVGATGSVTISSGTVTASGASNASAGSVSITAGSASGGTSTNTGGDVIITPGQGTGVGGVSGSLNLRSANSVSVIAIGYTGSASTLGFFNVTKVIQQGGTTDIKDALTSYGLFTGTSASPLNLDGGLLTAGSAALGTSPGSSGVLNFGAGTTAATGIYFGSDTNLYRSAADTLKTDDSINAAGAIAGGVTVLTDASTIAISAFSNHYRVTLTDAVGSTRVLGNPSFTPFDGQKISFEIIQSSTGSKAMTLGTSYAFGTDITAITLSTTANKRDFLGCIWSGSLSKWCVVSFIKGF